MTLLPIVARELRTAARKRDHYRVRFATGLVSILIGAWILVAMRHAPPQVVGKSLFGTLAILSFLYCLSSGVRITSDCLSEEKRDGTLGLLFLTDLKGYDVVLGKLVATSLHAIYGLFAFFPILGISLLLGGVGGGEFARALLVAVTLQFFSLAVGLFASAVCTAERKAMAMTILILLGLSFGPPLLGVAFGDSNVSDHMGSLIPSPLYNFRVAMDDVTRNRPDHFWISLCVTQLYAWGFLLAACRIVPHAWQDRARVTESAAGTRAEPNSIAGAERSRLLAINPFFWLSARGRFKGILIWVALFAGALLWLWLWAESRGGWLDETTFVMTSFLAHLLLKFWIAAEACRRFSEDRHNGALELLLCTPLSIGEILRGQQLALLRQFGGPVMAVLLADVAFLVLGMERIHGAPASRTMWLMTYGSGIVMFLLDLWALSWLSMWLGLSSAKGLRAVVAAFWRILILPWLIFGLSMTFFGLLLFRAGPPLFPEMVVPLYWLAVGVIIDLMFGWSARRKLHEQFRLAAAEKPGGRTRWFFSGRDRIQPEV